MSTEKGDPQLAEISRKLDILIRLSAVELVRSSKTRKEQIAILSDVGLQPVHIAGILGTSRHSVNVVLSEIRKERGTKDVEEQSTQKVPEEVPPKPEQETLTPK